MWLAPDWCDYELIDCGSGQRLERWGKVILVRPDPQAIWTPATSDPRWSDADGRYERSSSGGGRWDKRPSLPTEWTIGWRELKFGIKPMNFKHTGVFPEQAANWDFMMRTIREEKREISVLNLFGYTGAATLAAAAAGAKVCHVDAAKGMVAWGKENAQMSGLGDKPIRWIVDDCLKFVQREQRRGNRYDAILMDPPSYGRGPGGEVWHIEDTLCELVDECVKVLSDAPLFFIINSYTTGLAPGVLRYILSRALVKRYGGRVECDELGLEITANGLALPCGATGRWVRS